MENWSPILYRDFWDVPRIFLVKRPQWWVLFDCAFDDTAEDYPDTYKVYLVPSFSEEELQGSWAAFSSKAVRFLGEIPLASVRFDETRRREIESSILQDLLAETPSTNGRIGTTQSVQPAS